MPYKSPAWSELTWHLYGVHANSKMNDEGATKHKAWYIVVTMPELMCTLSPKKFSALRMYTQISKALNTNW